MTNLSLSESADKVVYDHVALAMASGFIPVPILDLAGLGGIQLKMIHKLGSLHAEHPDSDHITNPFPDNMGKAGAMTAITALSTPGMAAIGSSLLKAIPVIGPIVGSFTFHGYAGASTYALGKVFHQHFSDGGTLESFEASKFKDVFNRLLNKYKSENPEATNAAASKAPKKTTNKVS